MKLSVFILLFFTGIFLNSCQTTSYIYIVRHAEKSTEPANDPHLTNAGRLRSDALRDLLKEKKIKAIYSTETSRTKETGMPLSALINVPIEYYRNDSLSSFINTIIKQNKNTLIIGHSNTCVNMINSLPLQHTTLFIPDNKYDNMFIIEVKSGKAFKIINAHYGAVSPRNF